MHAKSLQFCPPLWDPMDCSPPGSSVHGIRQARILEWVVISFSTGSSQPGDRTQVSFVSCLGRWVLYLWRHLGSPFMPPLVFSLAYHSYKASILLLIPITRISMVFNNALGLKRPHILFQIKWVPLGNSELCVLMNCLTPLAAYLCHCSRAWGRDISLLSEWHPCLTVFWVGQ